MVSLISEMLRLMQCVLYALCRAIVPLCHIIYAISHHSSLYTLFCSVLLFFFGICSVDPVAIRGSIYIPRGRTQRQMQTQSSPAIICDLMLRRYHLHSWCLCVCVCVWTAFQIEIYVDLCLHNHLCYVFGSFMCVHKTIKQFGFCLFFHLIFSIWFLFLFLSPFCSRLVNVN